MAVYVDAIQSARLYGNRNWPYKYFCHLWADNLVELERMAGQLELDPEWRQVHRGYFIHYDIVASKRAKAIKLGARCMSLRAWLQRRRYGK